MKTKSIFLFLITMFISIAAISQITGNGSGTGANNGAVSGSSSSANKNTTKRTTHQSAGTHKKHSVHKSSAASTNKGTIGAGTNAGNPATVSNTGSSNGTMPANNDPGKETTSDKGKDGPANGVVKAKTTVKSNRKTGHK